VAGRLDEFSPQYVEVLHDRRMRRTDGRVSRANIDHIAVAASGVWVIDAKTHRGTVKVTSEGGRFGPRRERLYIGGRNRTALVDGLRRQVEAVRAELVVVGAGVPVHGALCFVGTGLPWFGTSIGDLPLVGRRQLGKILKRTGPLPGEERASIAAHLNQRFPPA
jgi:hypothetical protein